jgi:uncharacterized membrane protein
MNKSRVEGFSDGVFAIAITLLVLTLAQPSNYHDLTHQLVERWPSLAAYVVSFVMIGIMWLNHHTMFTHVARVDRTFFYLNLVLLMTIVFVPYPTGIFGEALQRQDAKQAAVFYSIVITINACIWAAAWLYASMGRRLLSPEFPEATRLPATLGFALGPPLYAAAIGVAFINPYLCLGFHGLLALYYAFDPISRRLEHAGGGEGGVAESSVRTLAAGSHIHLAPVNSCGTLAEAARRVAVECGKTVTYTWTALPLSGARGSLATVRYKRVRPKRGGHGCRARPVRDAGDQWFQHGAARCRERRLPARRFSSRHPVTRYGL